MHKFSLRLCSVVVASAFASVPAFAAVSPLQGPVLPTDSIPALEASAAVVIADPRHRAIRIELSAADLQDSDGDVHKLYRKLVKTRFAESASVAVAEGGRIFLRRASGSALAAAHPQDGIALKRAEDIASLPAQDIPTPAKAPVEVLQPQRIAPAGRPKAAVKAASFEAGSADESVTHFPLEPDETALAWVDPLEACKTPAVFAAPADASSSLAVQCVAEHLAMAKARTHDRDEGKLRWAQPHGVVALAGYGEAGEWLVLRA